MSNGHDDGHDSDDDADTGRRIAGSDELMLDDTQHPGIFVWLLTFSAGISGLLFGCMYPHFPALLCSSTSLSTPRPRL
jgi:hypothetical protein